jgi:hypothetical protein
LFAEREKITAKATIHPTKNAPKKIIPKGCGVLAAGLNPNAAAAMTQMNASK